MKRALLLAGLALVGASFLALPVVEADPVQGRPRGIASTRTISTTAPLTGGGDLSANRTIAIPAATASVDGYMTSTYATKLDGLGSGANAIGAASSTDNTIARWDGTGGKTIQASGVTIDDSNLVGLGTSAPTHSLTMSSTATGLALYNTSDQTTNYERGLISWSGSALNIGTTKAGSGTNRAITINAAGATAATFGSNGILTLSPGNGAVAGAAIVANNSGVSFAATSGSQSYMSLTSTVNQASGSASFDGLLENFTWTAVGSGGGNFCRYQSAGVDVYRVDQNGKVVQDATNTAGGTTGARTINKPTGTVNFAAGASSLVVTNSLVSTASIVLAVIRTNDTTALIKNVVPASGSFTITLNATASAETSVGFIVHN